MSHVGGDDLTYLNRLETSGYIQSSIDHYLTWTSRITIEIFVMFFSKYFFLWKLINPLIITGTVWILNKYAWSETNSKTLFLTFSLYCLIPLSMMKEAGWVATTLNYHWPMLFALLAFYPFYCKLKKKDIHLYIYILSILSLLFAGNQEQINLCFFVFTFVISIYLLKRKNYEYKLSLLSLISFGYILLFIFSPGNRSRTNAETITRFPEYSTYSIINKIDLGVSGFGKPFFLEPHFLFFIFFALISYIVYKKKKNTFLLILSTLPFIINISVYLGQTANPSNGYYNLEHTFPIQGIYACFSNTGTNLSLQHPGTWFPSLLVLGLIFCTCLGLYSCFKSMNTRAITILLFLMAVSSRIIMGFSPTIWASGSRTFFVTYVIITILILILLKEVTEFKKTSFDLLSILINVFGMSALLLSLFMKWV